MINSLKVGTTLIMFILICIVYPAYTTSRTLDDQGDQTSEGAIHTFVDTIRGKGYVDPTDYTVFIKNLGASGTTYTVSLEYYELTYQPNYTNPYAFGTFQNSFNAVYNGYFTDHILNILFPNNSIPEDDISRRFNMHAGDMFNVRLQPNDIRTSSILAKFFSFGNTARLPHVYGGMIRNEAP
jgi:hypothetical protein